MRSIAARGLSLCLAALMVHAAIAPTAALAQESDEPGSSPSPDTERGPGVDVSNADVADVASSPAADIGQDALQDIDPAAAAAVAGAARAASPRGPRTFALPSGPAKTAVTPQAISLPSAEGSIQGMGESFSPVLSSGTATFSVPIALPAGRAGVQPSLALSYSSSSGNGPLGIGWSMGVPFIARQTDRGLPRYVDRAAWHAEEDRFLYNGGQELVAVDSTDAATVDCHGYDSGQCTAGLPADVTAPVPWQQYRARVEGGFTRFFRSPDGVRWIVQSPDGTRFDFGQLPTGAGPTDAISTSANALETDRESDGGDAGPRTRESGRGEGPGPRVYRWLLTRMSDSHGSTVYYRYRVDGGSSYLDDIHYVSPHADCGSGDVTARRNCTASLSLYGRRVRLVYENRQDVWSSYASGWRMRSALRVRRIEVSAAQGEPGSRSLVRRYHLRYEPADQSFHSLLTSVQVEGRPSHPDAQDIGYEVGDATVAEPAGGDYGERTIGDLLPTMRFGYSRPSATIAGPPGFPGFDTTLHRSSASPPHSVDEAFTDLFDVNSDGLPDVVVTDAARYRTSDGRPSVGVFFNGFSGRDASPGVAGGFSDAVAVPMPDGMSGVLALDNLNLVPMDIDGDGRSDYLHMPRVATYGYFTPTRQPESAVPSVSPARQGWQWTYLPVALPAGVTDPRIDLGRDGARIKALDVNNDHLVDVVRTTGTAMQTWLNLGWLPEGDGRFGSASFSPPSPSGGVSGGGGHWTLSTDPLESCVLQAGIPLDFEDPEVRLADMNADGLQDIVKIRRGRVLYWPGRGPGLWGDGPASCARGDGDGRYVEMETPPAELDIEASAVYVDDIDEDGAADIVQVGFRDISVWLNRAGVSFTRRTVLSGTPPSPAFLDRVRFADIDGSATTDIVWAVGRDYRWIDPMGGRQPRVLVSVDNGLGALTTMELGSSVDDYLTDLAQAESCTDSSCDRFTWSRARGECDARIQSRSGQCAYRSGGSPVVSTVVRAVETTDRFDALGREANVTRTEFAYHDGYYEGIEQEFRGFGAVDARAIGDAATHPTAITRTHFLQGRRPNSIAADRLADNPDEALKGREVLTESFDELGRYLSSSHASYVVRTLHPPRADGRPAVSYAYVGQTDELRYDTSPFTSGSMTVELPTISRQDDLGATVSTDLPELVRIRGATWAQITSTIGQVDNVGHAIVQTAHGRTGTDQAITKHELPRLVSAAAWIWRSDVSWVDGPDAQQLGHTTHTYDSSTGDLAHSRTDADLPAAYSGGYAFGGGSGIDSFTQGAQDVESSVEVSVWGQPLASCAGGDLPNDGDVDCLRYSAVTYDDDYHQFPESESIAVDRGESPFRTLDTSAIWDRGLDAIDSVTDPNDLASYVHRDGLGRVTAARTPTAAIDGSCESSSTIRPSVHIRYELTDSPDSQPVSRVVTTTELSCAGGETLQGVAYVDGLGRVRAALASGDGEHAWVQSGIGIMTRRGTVERAYRADFIDASEPTPAQALAIPSTPHNRAIYDAFGRQRAAIAEDGSAAWTSYHALSSDVCDPLDNDPSSQHFRTCTTARTDGHGRVVDQVQRNRQPGSSDVECHRLWTSYRQDGATTSVVRAQTTGEINCSSSTVVDGHQLTRKFTYDTVGRRLGSTDPDTDSRTDTNAASRTWRYLFNRVGDLVAVRDPRDCGQNFYYDHGGRLLGERYVPCGEAQTPGEGTVGSVPVGAIALSTIESTRNVDVLYHFDAYPSWASGRSGWDHYDGLVESGTSGRPTGVTDRGQRSVVVYNDRGDVVWTARQMAVVAEPGTPPTDPFGSPDESITTSSIAYDDTQTYARLSVLDHAGRAQSIRLPTSADSYDVVTGAITYNQRGLPQTLSMTDGTPEEEPDLAQVVVSDIDYAADGATTEVTYGQSDVWNERDPVVVETHYDIRRRPVRVRVTRQPELDSNPQTLAAITRVVDQQYAWDDASNLTAVVDDRDPGEWPEGFRPQTTTIQHDSLYRVVGASFDYTQEDGSRGPADVASDYRDTLADIESHDPMRTRPAPMVAAPPPARITRLEWQYDWLANMTSWKDDADSFHERSLGDITNGSDLGEQEDPDEPPDERPSALRLATNLPLTGEGSGGWTAVEYGEGGNALSVYVNGQCEASGMAACDPGTGTVTERITELIDTCECAVQQVYVYRWDELNRLAESRRYEYDASKDEWPVAARQRYRYDAANQRTVKQTFVTGVSKGTYALYVYPGDFERRGLILSGSPRTYQVDSVLGSEDQYVVAGARYVRRDVMSTSTGGLDRVQRITIGLSDLIGTTAATLDLLSGEITETSTYYPNGATETYRALQESDGDSIAREPVGFTGKEADEEVGLVYFGERYLIPRLGRWATPDPLHVHAVGGGEALNSYHYVSGNLLQARDPLGLQPREQTNPELDAIQDDVLAEMGLGMGDAVGAAAFDTAMLMCATGRGCQGRARLAALRHLMAQAEALYQALRSPSDTASAVLRVASGAAGARRAMAFWTSIGIGLLAARATPRLPVATPTTGAQWARRTLVGAARAADEGADDVGRVASQTAQGGGSAGGRGVVRQAAAGGPAPVESVGAAGAATSGAGGATSGGLRLVVGGGRAPGFPALGPNDVSLNIRPQAVPHVVGTIARAPFRSGSFAAVYFENVPFFMFTGRYARALAEAGRVLRPGGRLVIDTGTAPITEIRRTLQSAGFTRIRVTPRGSGFRIEATLRGR